ncbi:MAG TPA: FAD-dependent oxidoreductase [Dyella sp.]|uniref:FAD-dependent oxidoreductase n=1 Tax=Dyella sp. TaxID=1869338 RepID=UPI002D7713DE|nr:FAD-dependent oxidoreductase [Dyella sp.]HET6554767.1 FAD-dependent oxidoreductase [Dyella sp.]
MASDSSTQRIDLALGIPVGQLDDGDSVVGRVGEDEVLLLRKGNAFHAISPYCTHYHGELAEGLVVGRTIRCPLHHACFDLATGEALRAPALDPLDCWQVESINGTVRVGERMRMPARYTTSDGEAPESVVIVGGGAAGMAAAVKLRGCGFAGRVTLLSADDFPPCDRPNLSKDYLAGTAPADWIPLRSPDFYTDNTIDLRLGRRVTAIDRPSHTVTTDNGEQLRYGKLLLATGAEPVRLETPGADPQSVHYLRTYADASRLVSRSEKAKRIAIIGASFIGLEVAASLRHRGVEVHVVGREAVPLERVMGADMGRWIQSIHEAQGVTFHLETTVERVEGGVVWLKNGASLGACDLIVLGVGVRPVLTLAEQAGLAVDRGVTVNRYLQTSDPDIFAAGDIARWPDPHTGERLRVEHWVVAQSQGQVAAMNMLGQPQAYERVPFFWSQHYDTTIRYVGHAEGWDRTEIDGSFEEQDVIVRYFRGQQLLAVAALGRELDALYSEADMEKEFAATAR